MAKRYEYPPGFCRRIFFQLLVLAGVTSTRAAEGMGQSGAFGARRLTTGRNARTSVRDSGCARWGWELVRRTSAPARLTPGLVAADDPALLEEPFVVWSGEDDIGALSQAELRGIEAFIRLGGVLIVDDSRPELGQFGAAARREIRRVLADAPVTTLSPAHVIFKSFYLVARPQGRILGPERVDAIVRGTTAQVLFLSCDLLGALASRTDGTFLFPTDPNSPRHRELAVRFAVNLAMYVLCSDYKDDQVHAAWLMRRRSGAHR